MALSVAAARREGKGLSGSSSECYCSSTQKKRETATVVQFEQAATEMEIKCEAIAAVSADAAVAPEAAVALNEQAATEMETKCEAVAAAVSADAAIAREHERQQYLSMSRQQQKWRQSARR